MRTIINKIQEFIIKHRLSALREVLIFCIITIVVHYLYRFWAIQLHYKPIESMILAVQGFLAEHVVTSSTWFLQDVLNIKVSVLNDKIYLSNGGWVGVGVGCSAFKPMLQFVILMVLFPGPWEKKLWFIPLGIIVIHLVNNFRIISLSLITYNNCTQRFWDISHDYILRPLFYAVIFTLWVIWVEILVKKRQKN